MSVSTYRDSEDSEDKSSFNIRPESATQICRIIQESLANVLKHSGATKVTIQLEQTLSEIRMSVEDNGHGFDGDSTSGGFGLGHITARARELNGSCEVIGNKGNGTRVLVTIPFSEEEVAT